MTAAADVIREDDQAIHTLVDNYTRFLAFLERRVASRDVAEDILQDAFVRSVEAASTIRERESVIAWFYRVLRNALTDHYRRRDAEARVHDRVAATAETSEPGIDEALMQQVCDCVDGLIGTLKPAYAEALRRVELDGLAVGSYAIEAGISANNASVRLHRAREALRRQVIRSCGTCSEHGCLDCACGKPVGSGPEC